MSRGTCESGGSFSDEHEKNGKEESTRLMLCPAAVSTRKRQGAVSPLIFFKVNLIPPDGRKGLLPYLPSPSNT